MNIDSYGLIVTRDGDGGDSCANTSRYLFCRKVNGNPAPSMVSQMVKAVVAYDGQLVRHPVKWNDIPDCSRDQQLPFMICLFEYLSTVTGLHEVYASVLSHHQSRGYRYQNLDWASPAHKNTYWPFSRRIGGDILLFLESLICVLDSFLFPSSSCGRLLNFLMMIMQINFNNTESKWTRWAAKIVKYRFRGVSYAIDVYHAKDYPELGDEMKRAWTKLVT